MRIKLNAISSTFAGKRVVLVDDSIVRGTTSARTIKRSDGSVLYDPAVRDANPDQVRALAAEACPTFNSVHMEGFDSLSPKQEEAFDKFIQYAQNQGTTVILALSPWHPYRCV